MRIKPLKGMVEGSDTVDKRVPFLALSTAQLAQASDLKDVSSQIVAAAAQLTGAEKAALFLLDESDGLTAVKTTDDSAFETDEFSRVVARQAIKNQDMLVEFVGFQESSYDANLCVSLCVCEKCFGAIYVAKRPYTTPFTNDDLSFLITFANQAASIINGFQLAETVERKTDEKSEFVSHVSHELRLPMTSIKGYTDLMKGGMVGELNEQQNQFLEVIQRNLQRMSTLISDLADMNRFENGRLHLDNKEIDLGQLIDNVADGFRELAQAREQTLSVDVDQALPLIKGDPQRVKQILSNLVRNAHQYSSNGGMILIKAAQQDEKFATIAISDNGIGIDEADKEKIYEPFYRAEHEAVRAQQGWGLGLSIAKHLIEAQGGILACESKLNEGSTFRFTLPL